MVLACRPIRTPELGRLAAQGCSLQQRVGRTVGQPLIAPLPDKNNTPTRLIVVLSTRFAPFRVGHQT